MSYQQDKYGILLPGMDKSINKNFQKREDSTLRIFTTPNGNPLDEGEIGQAIEIYLKELKKPPTVMIVPEELRPYVKQIEGKYKIKPQVAKIRKNGIHLSQ